jgi:hypothetical protein
MFNDPIRVNTDTSIVNLLTERVVQWLEEMMIDSVDDPTALGLARSGKLQDDPTVRELNLLIREGGDDWPDIIVPENYPLYSPQFEIGNPSPAMLRRFRAEYRLFFIGEVDRDVARTKANVIFSRFKHAILNTPLSGMCDDFGECAQMVNFTKHTGSEQGGPGTYIWRGEDLFEFLTITG